VNRARAGIAWTMGTTGDSKMLENNFLAHTRRAKTRATAAFALLLIAAGIVHGAEPPKSDSVAEITGIERKLEKIFNSEAFPADPAIALKYFDNTRLFDIMQPGEFRGDDFRKHFIEIGQHFQGKIDFSDLEVEADKKIGFASMIQHFSGKDRDGHPFEMVMRVTDCFHNVGGAWKIAHEHASLALDPATFMSVIKPKQ
jgi:ketosteroid isomerase-like protein